MAPLLTLFSHTLTLILSSTLTLSHYLSVSTHASTCFLFLIFTHSLLTLNFLCSLWTLLHFLLTLSHCLSICIHTYFHTLFFSHSYSYSHSIFYTQGLCYTSHTLTHSLTHSVTLTLFTQTLTQAYKHFTHIRIPKTVTLSYPFFF